MSNPVCVDVRDVHKSFKRGIETVDVLNGLNLQVAENEFVSLMGPSGSGKTTLLNLIAGLDRPTSGEVIVQGERVSAMTETQLAAWRTRSVGLDRKSTRLNSSHIPLSRMPSSA